MKKLKDFHYLLPNLPTLKSGPMHNLFRNLYINTSNSDEPVIEVEQNKSDIPKPIRCDYGFCDFENLMFATKKLFIVHLKACMVLIAKIVSYLIQVRRKRKKIKPKI